MKENKERTSSVRYLTTAAIIAALYVVLTGISAMLGISSGVIQVRLSEALAVLPFFTSAAVPGVTVGCFLANFLIGSPLPDVIFGTLASFLGVLAASFLRKHKYLVPLPTVLSNMLIIPFVLQYAYGVKDALWYLMLTVGIGEVISAGLLGGLLLHTLQKYRLFQKQ
ncbi:MAG: QueT transporter family protein [Lachnospiraceae bacterium]|nr:QueT transporter family protein [Lachnospiraceae bacterium]